MAQGNTFDAEGSCPPQKPLASVLTQDELGDKTFEGTGQRSESRHKGCICFCGCVCFLRAEASTEGSYILLPDKLLFPLLWEETVKASGSGRT